MQSVDKVALEKYLTCNNSARILSSSASNVLDLETFYIGIFQTHSEESNSVNIFTRKVTSNELPVINHASFTNVVLNEGHRKAQPIRYQ